MNCLLHGIDSDMVLGDTLSPDGTRLPKADVVLTNPPFGTKRGGGKPTRDDFTYVTGNKQLAFLQHIYRTMKPGGRAAVVLPDNVLFEEGMGSKIRADLMDKCNLSHHPTTPNRHLLRARSKDQRTLLHSRRKRAWQYKASLGIRPACQHAIVWSSHTIDSRSFRRVRESVRKEIRWNKQANRSRRRRPLSLFQSSGTYKRGENLDINWLKDDNASNHDETPEPDVIAAMIRERLATAMEEMDALSTFARRYRRRGMSTNADLLPEGWVIARGNDVFEFVRGVSYNKTEASDLATKNSVAILRAGNIQDGCILLDDLVHVPSERVRDEQRIRKGDLIIAMSSGSASLVGKVAVATSDMPASRLEPFVVCYVRVRENTNTGLASFSRLGL